jgi:Zn finger protein HypA/HybF involved in hydrogenase expression
MRRKSLAKPVQPIVSPEILEQAKRSISPDKAKSIIKCSVCGAEITEEAIEQLCWVCRRLKISAWRDIEQQMPAQE